MKSLAHLASRPASLPLSADGVVEFHAARLLLLLRECGVAGRIDGLTKMAKLDFFVRYPDFFEIARMAVTEHVSDVKGEQQSPEGAIESAMVRHHYGPWDKRYYHVLAYLESKGLIEIQKDKKTYRLSLTEAGRDKAKTLSAKSSFSPLVQSMKEVKKAFGKKNGAFLKKLIYRLFDQEVGKRSLGETIRK